MGFFVLWTSVSMKFNNIVLMEEPLALFFCAKVSEEK
jgi:hypothetical protein